jgi:hypothetical protein
MAVLTLTGANSVIMLSIAGLYPTPVQLQGFATDDVFDTDAVDSAETLMGVDGYLSAGWVATPKKQTYQLQADSPSNRIFDAWAAAQEGIGEVYVATGIIRLPAIGMSYAMTRGFLTSYKPTPAVKKIMQPRQYGITWQSVLPAPI